VIRVLPETAQVSRPPIGRIPAAYPKTSSWSQKLRDTEQQTVNDRNNRNALKNWLTVEMDYSVCFFIVYIAYAKQRCTQTTYLEFIEDDFH